MENNFFVKCFYKFRRVISSKRRNFHTGFQVPNDISIISCNCIGGLVYHDLHMKFLSPTINLFIDTPDFIKFCLNMDYYLSLSLIEDKTTKKNYPVGNLGDIKLNFVHYNDFETAKSCWEKRLLRINKNNIFVIITDRDKYSDDLLPLIDSIPFRKVFFSHKKVDRDYVVWVKKDRKKKMCSDLTEYINFKGQKKYEYYFDLPKWLSTNYKVKECLLNNK